MPDDAQSHAPNGNEQSVDQSRRRFLARAACGIGLVGAACALTPFVRSLAPSLRAEANAEPIEVDLSALEPGSQATVAWRGKPVWIIRRTQAMLDALQEHNNSLRDPASIVPQQPLYAQNPYRSIKPEYLIVVGICTHLGCSPKYQPQGDTLGNAWPGGFYCPCHGSTFDLAGRVFRGVPAPINLEVPPHRFINDHVVVIGEEA